MPSIVGDVIGNAMALIAIVAVVAFVAGYWVGRRRG
jgi:hypothetical protein